MKLAAARQHRTDAGAIPLPWCIVLESSLHFAHLVSRGGNHDYPTRRLQLRAAFLTIEGEPSRIAMCHCLACQRRTGAD